LINRDFYSVVAKDSFVKLFAKERWDVQELRSRLGIVSQSLQQNYSGDTIGLYVLLSGFYASDGIWQHQHFDEIKIQRAQQVAQQLGIEHLQDREFSSMSTGEQRRFLLGRALVHNPRVLVLDEPTSGLDISACFQYLETIRGLTSMGKKLILVTHHIHEIPPEVERVIFLKEGKIVEDDTKKNLLTSDKLSRLFDIPIKIIEENGYYQAVPDIL
jgi:iron complex transport system ATP-binding protein